MEKDEPFSFVISGVLIEVDLFVEGTGQKLMDDIENRERVQGESSSPGPHEHDHIPKVAVYDRPERKRLALWQFILLAVLFLAAAVVIYQLIF